MTAQRTNLWALRLLAIFAAIVVWFSTSFVKRERLSEKLIDATVTYNPARGIIILDPLQTVKVRLRGPDKQIRTLAPHVSRRRASIGANDIRSSTTTANMGEIIPLEGGGVQET